MSYSYQKSLAKKQKGLLAKRSEERGKTMYTLLEALNKQSVVAPSQS